MLFGTTAADPLVLSAAAIIMVGVSIVATLVPARQASHADPSELLRAE
jgi:ABC-type lipoprotein release transport system permease subunit